MDRSASITIRRQSLDVTVSGTDSDGLAVQRRLPALCTEVVAPVLESVLGSLDPGDAYRSIERVVLDLADVSLERLEVDLAYAVRRELEAYVRRDLADATRSVDSTIPEATKGLERTAATAGQWRTSAERADDALIEFLGTGRLPWSFSVPSESRLEELVLDAWAAPGSQPGPPSGVRARLREVLRTPQARTRLLLQFSPAFVRITLAAVAPEAAEALTAALAVLDRLSIVEPARSAFTRELRMAAIQAASAGERPAGPELVRAAWLAAAPAVRTDPVLSVTLERAWPGITRRSETTAAVTTVTDNRRGAAPSPSPGRATASGEQGDSLLVEGAGVVLLHPFLPRLFEGLGFASGEDLLDPGRAVCLIHHLATGELVAPEHRLVVAKVLCGLPVEEPVPADVGLTETETEEATALLEAAIGHWEALRNTSPDSLRVEFLMRPGLFSEDPDGVGDWLLRIEQRSADILLDQLPWGISMIRLPWMPDLLRVEWR